MFFLSLSLPGRKEGVSLFLSLILAQFHGFINWIFFSSIPTNDQRGKKKRWDLPKTTIEAKKYRWHKVESMVNGSSE